MMTSVYTTVQMTSMDQHYHSIDAAAGGGIWEKGVCGFKQWCTDININVHSYIGDIGYQRNLH